ncbi:MAG: Hsp33 family molecular chaperone HslO [Gammaproteobacteria bacterium]|nr:Hsp33 family molecular chaperone HslO [Gammaproteobacteria bacterium]MDH5652421.1 Hsp33 family molecular chaperone HslO [Gammaproteobacteria bacterium]
MSDTLQRFLFEQAPVRGACVQLSATWQAILERHSYPQPVRDLLGETMVAAVLLSSTLKLKGRMTLQMTGEGPLKLLMVECTDGHALRGVAQCEEHFEQSEFAAMLGQGRLVITLEPEEGKERYQSIVNLHGTSLAEALGDYLVRSEQLDTRLWLSADRHHAGGLLIQKLPGRWNEEEHELWERVSHLSATIKDAELLHLSQQQIVHRLYHEEDVRIFDTEPVFFRCTCTRDRVTNMLQSLGYTEVKSIIEEQGEVNVACEFCNQKYHYDIVDIEQIFVDDISGDKGNITRH